MNYKAIPVYIAADPADPTKKISKFPTKWTDDGQWLHAEAPNGSGIFTGETPNNLYVVDADSSVAAAVIESFGVSPSVKTRRGYHYYFTMPSGLSKTTNFSRKDVDIDGRGNGGLAFIGEYPLLDGTTFQYQIIDNTPQQMPPKLVDFINDLLVGEKIDSTPVGERSEHDFAVVCKLIENGKSKEEIRQIVGDVGKFKGRPDYFELTYDSAAAKTGRKTDTEDPIMWDSYNGKLLFDRLGNDVRFNTTDKHWYMWDGHIWERDDHKKVEQQARTILDDIHEAASPFKRDSTDYKRLIRQCRYSASRRALESALEELKHKEGITHSDAEFDANINLFNCRNGTYELDTNTFRAHRKDDLLTFTANVDYEAEALCPNWDSFLDRAMLSDKETVEYLKRFAGVSITGVNTSHLIFCYGSTGGNGKTVFLRTLQEMMGKRYCQTTKAEIIIAKDRAADNNGPSPYIARLKGARMVITNELPNDKRIDEQTMKQLTGGDMISADKKHQDVIDFYPTWTMWMVGNFRPKISDGSPATYRRLKEIPWEYQTKPDDRIEAEEYIRQQFGNEYSGILNWAIRGWMQYQANKASLNTVPQKVANATRDYIDEMDYVQHFIEDDCKTGESEECTINDLYVAFKEWCKSNHEYEGMGKISFSTRIENKGFKKGRSSSGPHSVVRVFKGISLKSYHRYDKQPF